MILGGRDVDGKDIIGFEVYDNALDKWNTVPEWQMAQGRYRYVYMVIPKLRISLIREEGDDMVCWFS